VFLLLSNRLDDLGSLVVSVAVTGALLLIRTRSDSRTV
jgi:hypothetical protein